MEDVLFFKSYFEREYYIKIPMESKNQKEK